MGPVIVDLGDGLVAVIRLLLIKEHLDHGKERPRSRAVDVNIPFSEALTFQPFLNSIQNDTIEHKIEIRHFEGQESSKAEIQHRGDFQVPIFLLNHFLLSLHLFSSTILLRALRLILGLYRRFITATSL